MTTPFLRYPETAPGMHSDARRPSSQGVRPSPHQVQRRTHPRAQRTVHLARQQGTLQDQMPSAEAQQPVSEATPAADVQPEDERAYAPSRVSEEWIDVDAEYS